MLSHGLQSNLIATELAQQGSIWHTRIVVFIALPIFTDIYRYLCFTASRNRFATAMHWIIFGLLVEKI